MRQQERSCDTAGVAGEQVGGRGREMEGGRESARAGESGRERERVLSPDQAPSASQVTHHLIMGTIINNNNNTVPKLAIPSDTNGWRALSHVTTSAMAISGLVPSCLN